MNTETNIIKFNDSFAMILPDEIIKRMRLEQGDKVSLVETVEGVLITFCNTHYRKQIELANKVMIENDNMLKKLAE